MKEIIVIIDNSTGFGSTVELSHLLEARFDSIKLDNDSIYYYAEEDNNNFLSFLYDKNMSTFYEKAELEYINTSIHSPVYYYVEFTDFVLLKNVIIFLSSKVNLLIDDDNGHINNVETFFKSSAWS